MPRRSLTPDAARAADTSSEVETTYKVDVVPSVWRGMIMVNGKNRPAYDIPTGRGDWMPTSPPAHDKFIANANEASGYKLQRVAQLVKHWRTSRKDELPIGSFYIEMFLATSRVSQRVASYAELVAGTFDHLYQTRCGPIDDPLGISGRIPASGSSSQAQELRDAVRNAREHSMKALENDQRGTTPEAYRQWAIVFNGDFPQA